MLERVARRQTGAPTEIEQVISSIEGSKGISIGNLTSQIFANIYLNELDRFVKNTASYYGLVMAHEPSKEKRKWGWENLPQFSTPQGSGKV